MILSSSHQSTMRSEVLICVVVHMGNGELQRFEQMIKILHILPALLWPRYLQTLLCQHLACDGSKTCMLRYVLLYVMSRKPANKLANWDYIGL